MNTRKKYTKEFRLDAIGLVRNGRRRGIVQGADCNRYGLTRLGCVAKLKCGAYCCSMH